MLPCLFDNPTFLLIPHPVFTILPKTMKLPSPSRLASFASLLLAWPLCNASAAVLPISDATYSGAFTPGTPENITGDTTLTGLTTTEGTFTGLLGATANSVTTQQIPSSVGTAPANSNVAASGLSANDGVNNLNTGYFQLATGTLFNANLRFFIIESTPTSSTAGDPTTVTLINAANVQVGTFSLTLTAANFTATAANTTNTALATLSYTSGVGSLIGGVQSKLGGVTFSLTDFTGAGDLSTVTGFMLNGNNQLDPNVVGAYVVPEPSAVGWTVAGLVLLGVVARRKICAT